MAWPGTNFGTHVGCAKGIPTHPSCMFVVLMDVLTAVVSKAEAANLFVPLHRWGVRHRLSIYADDVVMLIRPDLHEACTVVSCLEAFCVASGLRCNLAKSSASLIKCDEASAAPVLQVLGCPVINFPVKYLGLPLSISRLSKMDLQPYVDRVAGHLPKWKVSMTRRAGRLVLINSTLIATTIYPMLVLDLPPWFLSCIDKICRAFFWCGHEAAKGGSCLVNWNLVCTPKEYGGLGVKNLRLLNRALLMKWKWLEKAAVDKPWEGLQIDVPKEVIALFDASVDISLGDGTKTKFWTDRWLSGVSIEQIAPALTTFVKPAARHLLVADALPGAKWMRSIRGAPSVHALAEIFNLWPLLQQITLLPTPDRFRWRLEANGKFSARSAYAAFFLGREFSPSMAELWSSWAPLEIKIFVWLALHDRPWTADRLAKRNLPHPAHCMLCCQDTESANHLLLGCSFARQVWYSVLLPWRLHRFTPRAADALTSWWSRLSAAVAGGRKKELNSLICCTLRMLWLERNSRVFDKIASVEFVVTSRVRNEFALWLIAGSSGSVDIHGN